MSDYEQRPATEHWRNTVEAHRMAAIMALHDEACDCPAWPRDEHDIDEPTMLAAHRAGLGFDSRRPVELTRNGVLVACWRMPPVTGLG